MNLEVFDLILCIFISCEESSVSLKNKMQAEQPPAPPAAVRTVEDIKVLTPEEIPTTLKKETDNVSNESQ